MGPVPYFVLGVAVLAAVILLLLRQSPRRIREHPSSAFNLEDMAARHCRYFPQLRHAISSADERFLAQRASPRVLLEWRTSRRRVLVGFLAGLYEDFARLDRLARTVSRMAPQLDTVREANLFWMGLRFRLLYRLALIELKLGRRPARALLRLADMVGALGSAMEKAASTLAAESPFGRATPLTS